VEIPKKIDRVHFIYVFLITILIISFISGFKLIDSPLVIDVISITSGMISIIIGMLAISIAIYQDLTQETSIQKINESSNRVSEITKILEDMDLPERLDTIEEKITEKGMEEVINAESDKKIDLTKKNYQDIFLRSRNEIYFSMFILETYKKEINIRAINLGASLVNYREVKVDKVKSGQREFALLFLSYLQILGRIGALEYEKVNGSLNHIKITVLDNKFKEAIESREKTNEIKKIEKHIKKIL